MTHRLFKTQEDLTDAISILVHCTFDRTVLTLVSAATQEVWLPSAATAPGATQARLRDLTVDYIGTAAPPTHLLHLTRAWLPAHRYHNLTHAVFAVACTADTKRKARSTHGKFRILWLGAAELSVAHDRKNLKTPELMALHSLACGVPVCSTPHFEYASSGDYCELDESVLMTGKPSTPLEELVLAARLDKPMQELLYKEFLSRTFPAVYMNLTDFKQLIQDVGFEPNQAEHLFRTADRANRNALSFRDLLYFLAVTEPGIKFTGNAFNMRAFYLFRYLNRQGESGMNRDDFAVLFEMIYKRKNNGGDVGRIEKEFYEFCKGLKLAETTTTINFEVFKANLPKLPACSIVLQAPLGIKRYLKDGKISLQSEVDHLILDKYEQAHHCLNIKKSGSSVMLDETVSTASLKRKLSTGSLHRFDLSRQRSAIYFGLRSQENDIIRTIRYVTNLNRNYSVYSKLDASRFTWGKADPNEFANNLKSICEKVKGLFKAEPRLLQIGSPTYVLGDLHGNIFDLFEFEASLWHLGPGLHPCNLLFLGDYVDRGIYSVEVVAYLFVYKILSPSKVFLIRGNHEIQKVQRMWTFAQELNIKFGEQKGERLLELINEVFDVLPLAAVINNRIFCCHGGVPPVWLCPTVGAINDIPLILHAPLAQSPLAWELMWNDPVKNKEVTEKELFEFRANEGFADNLHRGTGHTFNQLALDRFLATNHFTHVIRAHELANNGFYLQFRGQLITIFSSSNYCNCRNEAACVLVDRGKLRFVKIKQDV